MGVVTAQYAFRQEFPFPAGRAFAWCVDFRPGDHRLEGSEGTRRVRRLAEDLILLTDTFPRRGAGPVTKVKLVRLRPRERAWTSTHLRGPNRDSQFWYRIVADGTGASHLEFTGLQVERPRPGRPAPDPRELARRLAIEDAAAWRKLAESMAADLSRRR